MTRLLEIKALLVGIYKKFDGIINPIGKFFVSLLIIVKLNSFFGYSPLFGKSGINLGIAVLAAFFTRELVFDVADCSCNGSDVCCIH